MTPPEGPLAHAVYDAILVRRKSLAETSNPLSARHILTELEALDRAADLLLYKGAAEEINIEIDNSLYRDRVVYAAATLKPAFLSREMDGEQAGTPAQADEAEAGTSFPMEGGQAPSLREVPSPHSQDEGQAGTSLSTAGGQAGTSSRKDGGQAGSFAKNGWQAGVYLPDYGWHAGVSTASNPESSAEGGRTGTSSPEDEEQAPFSPAKDWKQGRSQPHDIPLLAMWSPEDDIPLFAMRNHHPPILPRRLIARRIRKES